MSSMMQKVSFECQKENMKNKLNLLRKQPIYLQQYSSQNNIELKGMAFAEHENLERGEEIALRLC